MKIGDRVYYILEQMLHVKYLPGEILNITPRRVIIKLDDYKTYRVVGHNKIATEIPHTPTMILNKVERKIVHDSDTI